MKFYKSILAFVIIGPPIGGLLFVSANLLRWPLLLTSPAGIVFFIVMVIWGYVLGAIPALIGGVVYASVASIFTNTSENIVKRRLIAGVSSSLISSASIYLALIVVADVSKMDKIVKQIDFGFFLRGILPATVICGLIADYLNRDTSRSRGSADC